MLSPGNWLLRRSRIKFLLVTTVCGMLVVSFAIGILFDDSLPRSVPSAEDVVDRAFSASFAILAPLACWHERRIRWAQRAAMAWLFAATVSFAIDVARPNDAIPTNAPLELGAAAGALLFGAPCLLYVFLGRFRLSPNPIRIPPALLADAAERARKDMDRLERAHASGHETSVAFAMDSADGREVSILWGRVRRIDGDCVAVEPLTHATSTDPGALRFRGADVVDWEIVTADGREGCFLLAALTEAADRAGYDLACPLRRGRERIAGTFETGTPLGRAWTRLTAAVAMLLRRAKPRSHR